MKVAFFDSHAFEKTRFLARNDAHGHHITFLDARLNLETAKLAVGHEVVCAFANDHLDAAVLNKLKEQGTKLIALRSAGFNHVDLNEAAKLKLVVVRVPAYSPYAVAEHAVALLLTLNRKTHRAYNRVREGNFSLEGMVGFDLHGKKVGIVGTGKIGSVFAQIMNGFGCELFAYDLKPSEDLVQKTKVKYLSLEELYQRCDIISLHVPLTAQTRHLINEAALAKMKPGVFLINTGRGALIESKALIKGLKTGHLGAAGLDVYEEEEQVFFADHSADILQDDELARLLTFPNVLITGHQGFLTQEALDNIAGQTLQNISDFAADRPLINEVRAT